MSEMLDRLSAGHLVLGSWRGSQLDLDIGNRTPWRDVIQVRITTQGQSAAGCLKHRSRLS
jgi:hypothetical protein